MIDINAFTFTYACRAARYADDSSKTSLRLLKESTAADTVILVLGALQDTAHSEVIDWKGSHMPADDELREMIAFAGSLGLCVILKPFINCRNGTWRAHINFFDVDVPHEPQWGKWFQSYTDYQIHYAGIAQETNCEMIIIGCEMVQAQRKDAAWRELVRRIREVYTGLLTYNTDKYMEEYVTWWDALDVISSSGYYPVTDWEKELDRIEKVVQREGKPFFFAEAGCPSRDTSPMIPNDWALPGIVSLEAQANYYEVMLERCSRRSWVQGFGMWDWSSHLYPLSAAVTDGGYAVYGKPAAAVIASYYRKTR